MADDGSKEGTTWPMPKFRFEVDFGTQLPKIAFQEVSGMDKEVQIIEYRHSNSALFSTIKMPGIAKYSNVTMKRGVFVNDNTFWAWMDEIKMNTVARRTVLIKLLDEAGAVTMQWQLNNAWPTKITGTDLKSDGNEVAVDTIEIAHEQLIITNG
ncbi:phage tail protein [Pseudomonas syringae]|uniref:Phage tail protein n=2 Tax=Pseudomonas syringae TaxID=317 RepID=A0A244EQQ0_PSESX|nr:phage tail protein [Pseudomonas syringae]OUM06835.1 phage tail protein [Pseudomonas syringae]